MEELFADSTISDGLLSTLIGIRQEAGVDRHAIQKLIDEFACRTSWEARADGIGFPQIEDILQDRRADFLAAIFNLTPEPELRLPVSERYLTAADIWPSRS